MFTIGLRCVFQDVEPPKFRSILRKGTTVSRPIHIVQFSKNTERSSTWCDSTHQASRAQSIMLQSLRIGLRKRQKGKSDAPAETRGEWHKEFQSSRPTRVCCVPAPSVIKPEEREFVVDSGASMHMLSRKDLHSAKLETVRFSMKPVTVITFNVEVQTKEEATVYVKELELFVTVKLFDDTPVVLSLGKLCEGHIPMSGPEDNHHMSEKMSE